MKTLFRYLSPGDKFEAEERHGGRSQMVRRVESKEPYFQSYCTDCERVVGADAIISGVALANATRLNFVHICPLTYVFVD